jgi:hemolysin activation/secretion protein
MEHRQSQQMQTRQLAGALDGALLGTHQQANWSLTFGRMMARPTSKERESTQDLEQETLTAFLTSFSGWQVMER